MAKLNHVSMDDLRFHLDRVESIKASKRLMLALAYKDGVDVATLSERYGVPQSTIYYWFERIETQPLPQAVVDADRPGRPSKLSDRERESLRTDLETVPSESGYNEAEWTPELVQRHLSDEYDVSYSLGHVRRILKLISE